MTFIWFSRWDDFKFGKLLYEKDYLLYINGNA